MFYVYQHLRNDTGAVFYVGKGQGARARSRDKRNSSWQEIAKHGFTPEIIASDVDEELAFLVEREAIDVYRRRGIELTNRTNGGEGSSGYRHTLSHRQRLIDNRFGATAWGKTFKGKSHSEKQKALWSAKRSGIDSGRWKGKKRSAENRAKISAAKMGVPNLARRILSPEQVREIRIASREYRSIARVARLYNVGESTIRRIRDGKSYKDVI